VIAAVLIAFALSFPAPAATAARPLQSTVDAQASFERGVEAYRRGSYDEAAVDWERALGAPLDPRERARVAYDLGNAAWRRELVLEAVGWFTLAVRLDPRNADAWANLEHARAEAGLEPADRGDLRSTFRRLLSFPRPHELRWALALALLLAAIPLVFEALHGGKLWRRLSVVMALALALVAALWMRELARRPGDPVLVVGGPALALRSEPRAELQPIGEVRAGEELERVDALPGWVRLETDEGQRGWVRESAVFPLSP